MLVNCTPHAIVILPPDTPDRLGTTDPTPRPLVVIPPSGKVARVALATQAAGSVTALATGGAPGTYVDVPVVVRMAGQVTGLPDYSAFNLIIVSAAVATAAPDRTDLVVPDGTVFRHLPDGTTEVAGCRRLAGIAPPPPPPWSRPRSWPPALETVCKQDDLTVELWDPTAFPSDEPPYHDGFGAALLRHTDGRWAVVEVDLTDYADDPDGAAEALQRLAAAVRLTDAAGVRAELPLMLMTAVPSDVAHLARFTLAAAAVVGE